MTINQHKDPSLSPQLQQSCLSKADIIKKRITANSIKAYASISRAFNRVYFHGLNKIVIPSNNINIHVIMIVCASGQSYNRPIVSPIKK